MSDLNALFEQASIDVKKLSNKPSNDVLLKLYANFKQASVGDVRGRRPGFLDLKGGAKYDAWKRLKGQSEEVAKENYIALVNSLI